MTTQPGTIPESPVVALSAPVSHSEGQDTRESADAAQKRLEKRSATMQARSYATGFRVGDQVLTNTPRSPRFHNRTGKVVGTNLGEVGVTFTTRERADAWFLPAELTRVTA